MLLAAVLLAQRALAEHVWAVAEALKRDLTSGRDAGAKIVGRDTNTLSEADVSRAAIESAAENFSDGFVAPVFWFMLFGLPGMLVYKAVNTADSMIGHRTPRHEAFGWAAARLDDGLNIVPARLSGLILVVAAALTGADARGAWQAMWRDAGRHRSPNAGWSEAAMGGALGLALAGPRQYASGLVEDVWMNAGGNPDARPGDIARALRLFAAACAVQTVIIAGLAVASSAGCHRGGLNDRCGLHPGKRRGFAAGRHTQVVIAELARASGQLALNLDHQHADICLLGVRSEVDLEHRTFFDANRVQGADLLVVLADVAEQVQDHATLHGDDRQRGHRIARAQAKVAEEGVDALGQGRAVALDQAHGASQADRCRNGRGVFLYALLQRVIPIQLAAGLGMLFQVGVDPGAVFGSQRAVGVPGKQFFEAFIHDGCAPLATVAVLRCG
jgi:adenosylcobinamide-phosphate synthase